MEKKGDVRGKDEMKMPSARPEVSACHAAPVPISSLAVARPVSLSSELVTYLVDPSRRSSASGNPLDLA